jgi:Ni,Fe-hydrogenase maturation factor
VTPPPSAEIRTHTGSPESLLNLAAWLYDAHPAAWLVGIPAEQFEMGQHFSARTEMGVREALSQVERLIAEMENK